MKKQKVISSVVALSMSLSACTSGSGGPSAGAQPLTAQEVSNLGEAQSLWVKLFDSDHPNFALAELLTPWLWSLDSKGLEAIKSRTLALDANSAVANDLQKSLLNLKFLTIMGDRSYIRDENLLKNSVFSQYTRLESQGAFNLQIRLQTAAEAQAQAYQKVQAAFNEKVKQNSREIARDMVSNLKPEAIAEINNTKGKDIKVAVQEIYQILKKWDKRLDAYDFAQEDEYKLLLYGYVAAEIYDHLKTNPTVQTIVQGIEQLQDIKKKAKEVQVVLRAMDGYHKKMTDGWKNMKKGMEGIQNQINTNPDWNVSLDANVTEQTKRESIEFITDLLLGKAPNGKKDGESILSGSHKMNENAKLFFEGAASTANAVDGLISGTRTIANTLGIELDPAIEDALNTAQKITQSVKVAEEVASAFASDGLMGAFGALAGSGGTSLMMGPVGAGAMALGQMQMNAELGKINARLDEVIKTQKEILKLQRETLARLEDLSHKLDEYHNQEMLAIDHVEQEVIVNRRVLRKQIDKNLNSCTSLVNQINNDIGDSMVTTLSDQSSAATRSSVAKALAEPTVRNALLKNESLRLSYLTCAEAMTNAFSSKALENTPLSGILDGTNYRATTLDYDTKLYQPALKFLAEKYQNKTLENMALHLPVADFVSLEKKSFYWKRNLNDGNSPFTSDMNELASVDAIEKYVGALLSLYPLVTISSGAWEGIPSVTESEWNGPLARGQKNNLSYFWLKSALKTINIAIAQQSLLAGESILPQLATNFGDIVSEEPNCKKTGSKYCFVRENQIMATNALNYYLYIRARDPAFVAAYTQAFRNNSVQQMTNILGVKFVGRLELVGGVKLFWKASTQTGLIDGRDQETTKLAIDLPKPEDLTKSMILYSTELSRLVKLQEKVADELTKVTPNNLSAQEQQYLTSLVLFSYAPPQP